MRIDEALTTAKQQLKASTSDSIALDAELLLSFVLQKNRTYLYTWPEKTLSQTEQTHYFELISRRVEGHPIAHIVGTREFWGMEFVVTPDTLIPRPDTEILVETALEKMQSKNSQAWSFLDLGTGTGAIACAIKANQPNAHATAVDFQTKALAVAEQNARKHQLTILFKQGSWFDPVKGQTFDLIVSNPPYIEEKDTHLKEGDVRFEPITALTSGEDGLDDIRLIIQQAPAHLTPNGWLLIEHGYNQHEAVQTLFKAQGFKAVESRLDYGQIPRVTLGHL
ncbi:peptide chain release factor N(5)-glutamine methyltransferase [Hydrogenovibrio sp. 3SP14C1]|uniref:peptide chain release factor N(5)-glutamine methyltransferase n=1 Tax=Hydrogenovibrio sp. 3SP14C1 TaxID=3038774 RepID=UPI002417D283|nr:peptide chain release factor N(5)-glutamine methyltransferase [Hydrogenovibrio sp. 3SP14C1]MDG4812042.1 peptide chain release factor N(5)-glutamine methyltransferase [Hydrogenovibrio sp. 3SP14C1]